MEDIDRQSEEPALQWQASGDQLTIRPTGDFDIYSVPEAKLLTLDYFQLNPQFRSLRLDLRQATYVDSTALGYIVGMMKRLRTREGDIQVICESRDIIRIFEITGLHRVISISPSDGSKPVNESDWNDLHSEETKAMRVSAVMHQIGVLAQDIYEGKIGSNEHINPEPPHVLKAAVPSERLRPPLRKSSISFQTIGPMAYIEIINGSQTMEEATVEFFKQKVLGPDTTSVTIHFLSPSYIEKSYVNSLLGQIERAKAAGKDVRIVYEAGPHDVIPQAYDDLMRATGQLKEE